MHTVKQNTYKPTLLQIDQKMKYEFTFIICLFVYELFSIIEILVRGIDAIQWEVLWSGDDFMADFTNVIGYSAERNPYNHTLVYGLHEKVYPPIQYVFSYFLSNNTDMQHYYKIRNYTSMFGDSKITMLYIIFTVISVVCIYECLRKFKNGAGFIKTLTAFAVVMSYPVVFTIERGNTILLVFAFMMLFVCFYDSKIAFLREISYIALALAAALKMTPAIFGVLLIFQKRWKDALRTVIYGIACFILPFFFLKGGLGNLPYFFRNLSLNLDAYKTAASCTIMGFIIKYLNVYSDQMHTVCTIITMIICIVFIVAAFLTNRTSDKILYTCAITIFLPSHSATYCLLYIIPAFVVVLNESDKRLLDKFLILGACLCSCECGGYIGYFLLNHYNGLMIILLCTIIRAVETLVVAFKNKNSKEAIKLSY